MKKNQTVEMNYEPRLMAFAFLVAVAILGCSPKNAAEAHQKSQTISYQQDGKDFEGFIAYPVKSEKKIAAVLIIHEWDGLGDYVKSRTKMLAENGYFAFAMDMYGKGVRAKDHKEAAELSGTYRKDRKLMRSRVETALAVLRARSEINPQQIAIIGYCFGGQAALETALSGEDVRGVATFHASLGLPSIATDAKNIRGAVLIHNGAADKFVPAKDIAALKTAFDDAKVNYQFIEHKGAVHGFTNKLNAGHGNMGMAYDAKADLSSWASLLAFLRKNLN